MTTLTTAKKQIIEAQSLYCDDGEHDSVYHMQIVQLDADGPLQHSLPMFQLQRQYGRRGSELKEINDTPSASIRGPLTTMARTMSQKFMPHGKDQRSYKKLAAAVLPNGAEWFGTPQERDAILQGATHPAGPKHTAVPTAPATAIDAGDAELRACIDDGRWVGVLVKGNWREGKLECKADGRLYLDGAELGFRKSFYYDAKSLGRGMRLSGNERDGRFYAFDYEENDGVARPFPERIQRLADALAKHDAQAIESDRYLVGAESKGEGVQAVNAGEYDAVRFMRLDENRQIANIRIFPNT